MGSSSSKPESLRHLKIIVQDWFADINTLRDLLKDYIILYAKYPEKLQQYDPLFVKNIVQLFIRMDQFTNILRKFTVKILPQHSVNGKLIQGQIDKVPKLQEENSRLMEEKDYILKENSNLNHIIRDCQSQFLTLKETSDANLNANEDLQRENNRLHDDIQNLILDNQTLKGRLERESERYVNKEDEYKAKIQELEQQLLQEKEECEKRFPTYLKDAQAYQYQIKVLQRIINNREKEHQKDKKKETLEYPTENINDNDSKFNTNIHSPEDTETVSNKQDQDILASAEHKTEIVDVETTPAEAKSELVEETFDKSKFESEQTDPYVIESLEKIENIRSDVERLKRKVDHFTGTKDDKGFLHLREMLLRNIVKLDNVETEGHLIIRETRRELLRFVRKTLDDLKEKAN